MRQRYFKELSISKTDAATVDRLVAYLQKFPLKESTSLVQKYEWVPKSRIDTAARGADLRISNTAWMLFETQVNIGKQWSRTRKEMEYTYYEPTHGDDLMQQAIDEF